MNLAPFTLQAHLFAAYLVTSVAGDCACTKSHPSCWEVDQYCYEEPQPSYDRPHSWSATICPSNCTLSYSAKNAVSTAPRACVIRISYFDTASPDKFCRVHSIIDKLTGCKVKWVKVCVAVCELHVYAHAYTPVTATIAQHICKFARREAGWTALGSWRGVSLSSLHLAHRRQLLP